MKTELQQTRYNSPAPPAKEIGGIPCFPVGSAIAEKVTKISADALHEVEAALKVYADEVFATDLAGLTKDTYTTHSRNFVRWLKGAFNPGSHGR